MYEQLDHEVQDEQTDDQPSMFVVWIDCNVGVIEPPDWEMNSGPQPLAPALDEAADVRQKGWPAKVLPEGVTPRPDGLFENPFTR